MLCDCHTLRTPSMPVRDELPNFVSTTKPGNRSSVHFLTKTTSGSRSVIAAATLSTTDGWTAVRLSRSTIWKGIRGKGPVRLTSSTKIIYLGIFICSTELPEAVDLGAVNLGCVPGRRLTAP